ncbi:MAG: hypothetical protein IKJ64_05475 [Bacteroidales bacterium]|nr:hypothetical protein [Bacteroidales bacterium]
MEQIRKIPKEQIIFYESKTCANLHDKSTGLYLYSDLYIVDDFLIEMQNKQ